jgi:LysR family nitrogen assimilation transcriptional regulator
LSTSRASLNWAASRGRPGRSDIAQPALSRQVRLLEVELRQNLLLRNGRGVTTTEAGKLMLEHGRGILHQVARARGRPGPRARRAGRPRGWVCRPASRR